MAASSYHCELFFSTARRLCHQCDTPKRVIEAIENMVLKDVLDFGLDFSTKHKRMPSDYTSMLNGPVKFDDKE